MTRDKLTSLVVEVTGGTKDDAKTKGIVGTFWALKVLADFEDEVPSQQPVEDTAIPKPDGVKVPAQTGGPAIGTEDNVVLRVGYTINLNLPETSEREVFNAIFKDHR